MPDNYAEFQSIPIDFDVFKTLTARLESPADSYNRVLRRLLQLPTAGPEPTPMSTSGHSWHVGGVTFPAGPSFARSTKGGPTWLASKTVPWFTRERGTTHPRPRQSRSRATRLTAGTSGSANSQGEPAGLLWRVSALK